MFVRIGIGSGPVYIVKVILGSDNVWGPAIIGARRIMDLGLDRHILISLAMRNELMDISPTSYSRLIDKPMRYSVKHGLVIRCCNVHGDGFGRATPPRNKN